MTTGVGDGLRYWDYNTEILNFGNLLAKNLGLPTAMDFYRSRGLHYNNY